MLQSSHVLVRAPSSPPRRGVAVRRRSIGQSPGNPVLQRADKPQNHEGLRLTCLASAPRTGLECRDSSQKPCGYICGYIGHFDPLFTRQSPDENCFSSGLFGGLLAQPAAARVRTSTVMPLSCGRLTIFLWCRASLRSIVRARGRPNGALPLLDQSNYGLVTAPGPVDHRCLRGHADKECR